MSNETLFVLFLVSYGLTGLALAAVLVLGRKRAIKGHVTAVGAFVTGFAVVLVFAEWLGHRLVFEQTIERIHLCFAFSGAGALLAPIITGWRRLKKQGSLGAHHVAIATFLILFVGATVTGGLMLASGKPREAVEAPH